jgi:hypothetical protein
MCLRVQARRFSLLLGANNGLRNHSPSYSTLRYANHSPYTVVESVDKLARVSSDSVKRRDGWENVTLVDFFPPLFNPDLLRLLSSLLVAGRGRTQSDTAEKESSSPSKALILFRLR